MTELADATRRILLLRRRPTVTEAEWEEACDAFTAAVMRETDAAALRIVLGEDADVLLLPFDLKDLVYERLLQLDGRDPATLREYAWHLQLQGADRDDEADRLIAEADGGDGLSR